MVVISLRPECVNNESAFDQVIDWNQIDKKNWWWIDDAFHYTSLTMPQWVKPRSVSIYDISLDLVNHVE